MKRWTTVVMRCVATLALVGMFAPTAMAEDAKETIGEVHVAFTNASYVKVEVNGEEWSGTEFDSTGKKLVIKGLELDSGPFEITLSPFDEGLEPATIEVAGDKKAFRRQYDRALKVHILVHKAKAVTFAKRKGAAPPPDRDGDDDGGDEPTRPPEPPNEDTDL